MNTRLVSYLEDNRDQIIENWLTEADVPAPANAPISEGFVPVAYLETAFDRVVARIADNNRLEKAKDHDPEGLRLNDIFNVTCACQGNRVRGRVCMELHATGRRAFMSVFEAAWDTEGEFNELDRRCCEKLINDALAWIFTNEVFTCSGRHTKADCHFHV